MSYALKYSKTAEDQIEKQQLWYEADEQRGGLELSVRWIHGLFAAVETITAHPQRYPFAPENGRWMKRHSIRQLVYRPWQGKPGWRVLYVIKEKSKVISILDIRHESRRWLHDS